MIARLIALVTTWIFLWGEISVGNLLTGVIVGLLIIFLFPSKALHHHRLRPIGSIKFLARLVFDLFTSSWAVVVTVLRPTPMRLHSEVFEVALTTTSPFVATIVANSLTLTPGSMTVAIEDDGFTLRVHVLGQVDTQVFIRNVHALEQRVIAAVSVMDESKKNK